MQAGWHRQLLLEARQWQPQALRHAPARCAVAGYAQALPPEPARWRSPREAPKLARAEQLPQRRAGQSPQLRPAQTVKPAARPSSQWRVRVPPVRRWQQPGRAQPACWQRPTHSTNRTGHHQKAGRPPGARRPAVPRRPAPPGDAGRRPCAYRLFSGRPSRLLPTAPDAVWQRGRGRAELARAVWRPASGWHRLTAGHTRGPQPSVPLPCARPA